MCQINLQCYKSVVFKNNVYNNIYRKPYLFHQFITDTLIAKTKFIFVATETFDNLYSI